MLPRMKPFPQTISTGTLFLIGHWLFKVTLNYLLNRRFINCYCHCTWWEKIGCLRLLSGVGKAITD